MTFRIDVWIDRGVQSHERETKREANTFAEAKRNEKDTVQTVVTFPNGTSRIARNTKKTK